MRRQQTHDFCQKTIPPRKRKDRTRLSIVTCSTISGLPTHGYRKNGLRYERRRFIINRVWQHPGDSLIEILPPAFDRTDIINGAVAPRKRTPFPATRSVPINAVAFLNPLVRSLSLWRRARNRFMGNVQRVHPERTVCSLSWMNISRQSSSSSGARLNKDQF